MVQYQSTNWERVTQILHWRVTVGKTGTCSNQSQMSAEIALDLEESI